MKYYFKIVMIAMMLIAATAGAAVYCVNPADDISAVIKKLQAGDKVLFSAGKYKRGIFINKIYGTEKSPVIIKGEKGAVIIPEEQDGILVQNSKYININGFEISGARRAGILVFASKYITVEKCVLHDNSKWGLQTCLSDYISVENCDISGSKREHGIYFSTTDHPVVKSCRIYNNRGCGIHFNGDKNEGGDGMISDGVVSNNIIYGNGLGGGAAINMDSAERMVISNNKIYGNNAGGITSFCEDGARAGVGNRFLNNSVAFERGKGRYALQLMNGSSNAVVIGNNLQCGRGPALEIDKPSLSGLIFRKNKMKVSGRKETVMLDGEWKRGRRIMTNAVALRAGYRNTNLLHCEALGRSNLKK